jgi:hypothetical protein
VEHPHLRSGVGWTKAAIDSALERGSLAEWRELFDAVKLDQALAAKVLDVARKHPLPGVLTLVTHLIKRDWPNLDDSKTEQVDGKPPG